MSTTYARTVFVAAGPELLTAVRLRVGADWAYSATDYWTFTARIRRARRDVIAAQSYGEVVGSTYDLSARNLTAGVPVTLYDDARGTRMNPGDQLLIYTTKVGSPAALTDPKPEWDVQALAR